jgi:DME family drug/metabolite transporter
VGNDCHFRQSFGEMGFSEMEIVTLRVGWAAIFLFFIGIVKYRSILSLKKVKDIRYFIGTGIISIVFFNWCYFTTMNELNISLAVILLYTSPAFVTILSCVFLREKLNGKKVIAVVGTIIGCALIAGMSGGSLENVTFIGVMIGLGSGFFYALYSIFSKFALETYPPFTVTFYTFVIALLFLLPITQLWTKSDVLWTLEAVAYSSGLGLFPTVFAYILYTAGLEKVESSKASILATVEPLVATFLGILLYKEVLNIFQWVGAFLILASVISIQLPKKNRVLDNSQIY